MKIHPDLCAYVHLDVAESFRKFRWWRSPCRCRHHPNRRQHPQHQRLAPRLRKFGEVGSLIPYQFREIHSGWCVFPNPVVPLEMLYFFSPGLNMGDHQCRLVQCFSGEWSQLHVGTLYPTMWMAGWKTHKFFVGSQWASFAILRNQPNAKKIQRFGNTFLFQIWFPGIGSSETTFPP